MADLGQIVYCPECEQVVPLVIVDDSFDYAGTHCTFGRPGTHHIPTYLGTECCSSTNYEEDFDEDICHDIA